MDTYFRLSLKERAEVRFEFRSKFFAQTYTKSDLKQYYATNKAGKTGRTREERQVSERIKEMKCSIDSSG